MNAHTRVRRSLLGSLRAARDDIEFTGDIAELRIVLELIENDARAICYRGRSLGEGTCDRLEAVAAGIAQLVSARRAAGRA